MSANILMSFFFVTFSCLTFNHKIMKNSKLFTLVIAIAVVIVSCHLKRDKLVNSWKVTAVEPKEAVSDSTKNAILANGMLTFTEDGHVTGYLLREITDGTYALTQKGKKLVIKDEVGTPYECVSTITEDQLILDTKEAKLTFSKI
ncbi:hypothetical protein SAMN06265220_1011256 [Flavobacterium nitrogenifigens]|uniref:Lipocalin-like domain-containing protein n=2 Tax=Flavobacterium nitrogenifigens TaxID=1617283 RepID=A0A521BQJ6_9FLAO|nr:hypothetical protein SAMN06265220_1011256 [Flavobacterium nitrogenifigens]